MLDHAHMPPVRWRSIERELPLLISGLVLATVVAFAWTAAVRTERIIIKDASARITGSAKTVANLLVQAGVQSHERAGAVAADTAIQRYLIAGGDPVRARRALAVLVPAANAASTPGAHASVRRVSGAIALDTAIGRAPRDEWLEHALGAHPDQGAMSPILAIGDSLYLAFFTPIARDGRTIGYVSQSSYVNSDGAQALKDLIGPQAILLIGSAVPGGVWSDLARPRPAPPAFKAGVMESYDSPAWGSGLGIALPIQGTPWILWVAQPRSALLTPIRRLLTDLGGLAIVFIVIGIAGGLLVSRRITRPVVALTEAAEQVASSDEATVPTLAVKPGPGNEVGRLVDAFARMSSRVNESRQAWEEQVEEAQALTEELEVTNDELADSNRALAASERSLSTTLDSIADAVIAADMDGRVTRLNPVAERLTGWSKAQAIGRPLETVFQVDKDTLVSRDGTRVPIATSRAAIRDAAEAPSGVVLVFRDLTEERRIAEVRMHALRADVESRRAQEASRLKSEFLANMSHELRTPLNAIIGFTELLHAKKVAPTSPEHDEYLGDVLTSSKHLLQLINDILDLSKVEAGKLEFFPEGVDLTQLVGEVVAVLHPTIAEKHIHVTSHVDDGLTDVVMDAARFKQVLYNYVSNALKFTPAAGRVTIRIGAMGSHVRLEVADTGIGIAPQDIPRLFTPFEQLDSSIRKHHAGTGLGLALVKRLVEAQGGSVGVTSIEGDGATFVATLPRRPA